jgi:hypothetical protein
LLALRTTDTAEFISLKDSALDKDADGFDAGYLDFYESGNRSALKLVDGGVPTIFQVKRLSRRAFEHCMRQTSAVDQVREALAFGLVSVTDWFAPGEMKLGRKKSDVGGEQRLDDATMDKFFEYFDIVKELGDRILTLSTVPPSKGQR